MRGPAQPIAHRFRLRWPGRPTRVAGLDPGVHPHGVGAPTEGLPVDVVASSAVVSAVADSISGAVVSTGAPPAVEVSPSPRSQSVSSTSVKMLTPSEL